MAIDWASMTDEELEAELNAGMAEAARRRDLASIPEQSAALNYAYLEREGITEGMPWRQPGGAYNAYPLDWIATHNGKDWRSLIAGNVYEPGVAGWRQEVAEGEYPDWVQPVGAPDAYMQGDEVAHLGKFWRSDIDANTYEPPLYWTEFTPGETIPAWQQPTGGHDAYSMGDLVHHNGRIWSSNIDANVFEPPSQWTDEGPYEG